MRFNQGIYRYLTTYFCTNVYLFNAKNKEELQGKKNQQRRSWVFCQNNVLPIDEKIIKQRHMWPNQGTSASAKVCPSKETSLSQTVNIHFHTLTKNISQVHGRPRFILFQLWKPRRNSSKFRMNVGLQNNE